MGMNGYDYDELKAISSKEELEAFEKQNDEGFKARTDEINRLAEEEALRQKEAEEQEKADAEGMNALYNESLSDKDITFEER